MSDIDIAALREHLSVSHLTFLRHLTHAKAAALLDAAGQLQAVTAERDAYRKAKQENDDRFMRERDAAREQRDALLSALEPVAWQLESAQRSTAPAFLKGFHLNDADSGALLRAIRNCKETNQ